MEPRETWVKTQASIFPSVVLFQNGWEREGCLFSVLFPSLGSPPFTGKGSQNVGISAFSSIPCDSHAH